MGVNSVQVSLPYMSSLPVGEYTFYLGLCDEIAHLVFNAVL